MSKRYRYQKQGGYYTPRKRRIFSRYEDEESRYTRGRGYRRGREYRDENRRSEVTIQVGRRYIWIFNNTERSIEIAPNKYLKIEILEDGETRFGPVYRTALVDDKADREERRKRVEVVERDEEWV